MSGRYIARKLVGALVTIVAIVILNFVLFRMMPGSPERATKNPHLTPEFVAAERAKWGLDKPLFPDQLTALHRVDPPGRPRLLDQVPGPAGHRGRDGRGRTDGAADRARRGDRDRRRPVARRPLRLATGRRDRSDRQRPEPGLLLDAVLRDRHAADHHLRLGPALVPDLGHDHARRRQGAGRGPVRSRPPPRPAADRRGPRPHRGVLDPDALVDHRDAFRGLHHDGAGEGPVRQADPELSTRSRTRCCRW